MTTTKCKNCGCKITQLERYGVGKYYVHQIKNWCTNPEPLIKILTKKCLLKKCGIMFNTTEESRQFCSHIHEIRYKRG